MTDNTLPQDAWLKEAERLIEEFGFACMAADSDEDVTQSCAALLAHILARPASPAVPPDLSDKQIEDAVFAVLRKWNDDQAWARYTRESGPYDLSSLRPEVLEIVRAVFAASPALPVQPEPPKGEKGECNHSWTDESASNGWRSNCRHCGLRAQGSGQ